MDLVKDITIVFTAITVIVLSIIAFFDFNLFIEIWAKAIVAAACISALIAVATNFLRGGK